MVRTENPGQNILSALNELYKRKIHQKGIATTQNLHF
jgi:hypothetical protein